MEMILLVINSYSKASEGIITNMSCGRSKFVVADSFACVFPSLVSPSCFLLFQHICSRLEALDLQEDMLKVYPRAKTWVSSEEVNFEV